MTPWGLRSKLKSAIGRAPPAQTDQVTIVMVLPSGSSHTVTCEARYTLVMASQTLDTPISTGCPDGHCGGCTVDVLDGSGLAPPSASEQRVMTEKAVPEGQRLACHAKIASSGARVKVHGVWTMDSVRGT